MQQIKFRLWFYGVGTVASSINILWFLYASNMALYLVCGVLAIKNIDSLIDAIVAYQRKRFNR